MKDQIALIVIVTVVLGCCVTSSQAQQWTPDPFCPFPSDHVTRYPYYGNCSVYWECYEGTKYVMPCPEGLEFNAPLQQCDSPVIANCDPFASTTENPNPPTWTTISTSSHEPGPDCPYPSDVETFYPYEGDCTKYWECYEGDAYLYNCPDGLWWHQEISECDYPGDFCDNSSSTGTTDTTGSTESTISTGTTPDHGQPNCEGTGDDPVYYPYEGDCTKYWECANNAVYVNDCPEGLWWHQEIGQCDYPGDYCGGSTHSGSTETTPTTSGNLPDCSGTGDDPVYYPYDGDCTKYWECANGQRYLESCPEGLWWHEEIGECDYPGTYCADSL